MFKVHEITNTHRHRVTDKKQSIPISELFNKDANENKPMPYFSVVPEQVNNDTRYQKLSRSSQGDFLRLCILIAGPGELGRFMNFSQAMSGRMDMTIDDWEKFRAELLEKCLLKVSEDGSYLLQPELREQCLLYVRAGK